MSFILSRKWRIPDPRWRISDKETEKILSRILSGYGDGGKFFPETLMDMDMKNALPDPISPVYNPSGYDLLKCILKFIFNFTVFKSTKKYTLIIRTN